MKLLIQNKANHSTIFDEWNQKKEMWRRVFNETTLHNFEFYYQKHHYFRFLLKEAIK